MRSWLSPLWIATLLIASGCAHSFDHPKVFTESAFSSRVAAVVGYDEDYVKSLTETIETIRSTTDRKLSDQVDLLFALDELAEIYTYRQVDFERALAVNQEVEALLANTKCCQKEDATVGLFFPRHRQLYQFVWMDEEGAAGQELRKWSPTTASKIIFLAPNNAVYLRTVFPHDFLDRVSNEDLQALARRVRERNSLLERMLGKATVTAGPKIDFDRRAARLQWELSLWKSLLGTGPREGDYARALVVLEQSMRLKDQVDEQKWLRTVADAAQKAFAAEAGQANLRPHDVVRLRFRAGLVNMRLGRFDEGAQRFDEMLQAVNEYDNTLKGFTEEGRSSDRKYALLATLLGILARDPSVLVGAPLTLYKRGEQRKQLFGEGSYGLRAFLNEHERLAFHYELGYGYEKVGRRPDAIAQYKAAIELIEKQRATLGSEEKRIQFLKDKEAPYKRLIPLLIEDGEFEGAFDYMERARSRAFVDLLAGARLQFATQAETQQYQAVRRKQAELEVLVNEAGVPREVAESYRNAVRGIKVEKDEPAAPSVTPEFDSLSSVQTAAVGEFARVAGKDAALLAFFVSEEKTTVMLVQDGRFAGWVKPLGRAALAERVQTLRRFVEAPGKAQSIQEIQQRGRELYRDLLGEAGAALKKSIVYVLPHGPLHYLPFAALYDGSGYLVDRLTLLTVPSATVLTYLEKKPQAAQGAMVVFANPDLGDRRYDLPFADQEGAAIHARVPESVLLRRGEAMEARARKAAPEAKVLHFATHATFKQDRPLDSAVMLAPGDGQDGALTAGEIFGLKLPGSLVVLSGCETGMGKLAAGDELIGLTRAFMYAGAPQLLATLWQVDDKATATLMADFYKELGMHPAAEALRIAQISVRTSYPHPFYWAAFTIFGHHR